ncbi:hypothetical protein D3C80_1704170 [compost metagenome]
MIQPYAGIYQSDPEYVQNWVYPASLTRKLQRFEALHRLASCAAMLRPGDPLYQRPNLNQAAFYSVHHNGSPLLYVSSLFLRSIYIS